MLPYLNKGFAPTAEEYATAKEIVDVFDEAFAKGDGTPEIGGRSLDLPIAERARKTVNRQKEIEAFEAYKSTFKEN